MGHVEGPGEVRVLQQDWLVLQAEQSAHQVELY